MMINPFYDGSFLCGFVRCRPIYLKRLSKVYHINHFFRRSEGMKFLNGSINFLCFKKQKNSFTVDSTGKHKDKTGRKKEKKKKRKKKKRKKKNGKRKTGKRKQETETDNTTNRK